MRASLINSMVCPYCGGAMHVVSSLSEDAGDIRYGLVECRCFVFPVVEGILLLSLAKGYGGAEEMLQPYVPLQAAAVQYLQRGDTAALQAWIRKHAPLAAVLLDGEPGTYLEYSVQLARELEVAVDEYLGDYGRYGVLGTPRRRPLLARLREALGANRTDELAQLQAFYPTRFFSPYSQSTLMQLGQLPLSGRVLSLCSGQGMFENLLNADTRPDEVVSVDGQFLNLLLTRRYIRPQGQFICQDLQLGLPFADGSFDAVFSSTCLPEIPAQREFVREAIRVTGAAGWSWFDCVWNGEIGGHRIDPNRHYRFAQNYFTRLDDYPPFFAECAGARTSAIAIPTQAGAYRDGAPRWARTRADIEALMGARSEPQLSALIFDPAHFPGFVAAPRREWLHPGKLSVSPAYEAAARGDTIVLNRRAGFASLGPNFAPRAFGSYPETFAVPRRDLDRPERLLDLYCAGLLTVLPQNFDRSRSTLAALAGA